MRNVAGRRQTLRVFAAEFPLREEHVQTVGAHHCRRIRVMVIVRSRRAGLRRHCVRRCLVRLSVLAYPCLAGRPRRMPEWGGWPGLPTGGNCI
jgi:hypothetical protein